MRTVYTNLDIKITIDHVDFYVLNIIFEHFLRSIPKHSHGLNSYELHYIPYGYGTVYIDGRTYALSPNTLYITGPNVEHEQIPDPNDPMAEYCIYFKLKLRTDSLDGSPDSVSHKFISTSFWFGTDSQDIYSLMRQIFSELKHRYTGYIIQVESLLQQCVVKVIRNYESHAQSKLHFCPSNLVDSKYIIVEECFLYEYESITLENLSDRLGLSTRQTERFLKEYYGKTFLQKKTEAKMSVAVSYLSDPALSISEISERLNYSSIQHFSYAFKKYYGVSASSYRKRSIH